MAQDTLHLISFTICPFVQRSRILLNSKNVEAEITYIDLDNKPDWFQSRVPTGKVPAVFVGDETLFESSAINEYLDEVTPGAALGDTPLERAQARVDQSVPRYRHGAISDARGDRCRGV